MEYVMESVAYGQGPLPEDAKNLAKKAEQSAPHIRALYLPNLFSASSDLDSLNLSSVSLPHFADAKDLPSRLPTKEEIESSKDVLRRRGDSKVVGVGPHFVVKYGVSIDPTEGQNILFVQRNTSVPVPRVYAIYTDTSNGKTYIIMERVTGDSLASLWRHMSEAEKSFISAKLRRSMDQLRRLPSPGSYCSLGNRGLLDPVFWTETGGPMNSLAVEGPFNTEDELNAAMITKFLSNIGKPQQSSFYANVFRKILRGHRPIFTHGFFRQEKIIVRKLESLDGVEDLEVILIGWDYSGWYPSYWEYAMAFPTWEGWDNDWNRWIPKILDEYLAEWPWMQIFQRRIWP